MSLERITTRLSELVRIASPTGREHDAIDLVESWLRSDGADEVDSWVASMTDLETDPAYPGREVDREDVPVVAARLIGNRPGPVVVLTGHVDTVDVGDPSRWSSDPFGARVDGDLLFGRGACDMKAGVVAAVEAFRRVADGPRDFAGELRFVAVPGEEDGGTGTLAAIRRGWSGDFAIITEPTGGDIVVAHGGALTFSIDVEGAAAHGSKPAEGVSALEKFIALHPVIQRLAREANTAPTNPFMAALDTPYATTIGIVRGGSWASNVMESLRAEARVGVRVGESVPQAVERFVSGLTSGARAADEWFQAHPPLVALTGAAFASSSIDPEHDLVHAIAEEAQAAIGRRPRLIGAPYGCDMAMWSQAGGCPALVYGPGDVAVAHAPDEHVSLRQTAAVATVLTATVRRLLA